MNTALARRRQAPLGETVSNIPSTRPVTPTSRDEVAFNLELPILESTSMLDVMRLRKEHVGEFQGFQAALKKAIEERLRAMPDSDAETVANSVYDDIIEPEIIAIDRRISAAADGLVRRNVASAAVGSVITTVGLISFGPIAATGVAVGAAASLASYVDWLKDKKEVQLSDMHFLWRVDDRAADHKT